MVCCCRTANKVVPEPLKPEIEAKPVEEVEVEDMPGTSGVADLLKERKNIYDNDQFDVMNFGAQNSVDTLNIHRGKREKSDIEHWETEVEFDRLRELYNKYDLIKDGESEEEEFSMPGKS